MNDSSTMPPKADKLTREFTPLWERKKKITKREQQLLDLEAAGLSHAQIAGKLGIKTKSVNDMKYKATKKLKKVYIPSEGNKENDNAAMVS